MARILCDSAHNEIAPAFKSCEASISCWKEGLRLHRRGVPAKMINRAPFGPSVVCGKLTDGGVARSRVVFMPAFQPCRESKKEKSRQLWCKKTTLARFVFAPASQVIAPDTAHLKLRHAVIRHLVTVCPFGRFLPGLQAAFERPSFLCALFL